MTDQERVDEAPAVMVPGAAVRELMSGRLPNGITGLDDAEGAEVPAAFVAVTANV